MNYISSIIIPLIIFIVIGYGLYKNINIYDSFIKGVEEGLATCLNIFPTIFTMYLGINILLSSNIINDIASNLKFLQVPVDIIPLALLRPISGSSSLIIMDNILKLHGPDSYIGRIASVIQSSTDTTIYVISLYFGSIGIKKIRYSLLVGMLTDLFCVIVSVIVISIFF